MTRRPMALVLAAALVFGGGLGVGTLLGAARAGAQEVPPEGDLIRGALQDLAGAGEHGDPLPDDEKELRAKQAEWQRVYAEALSRDPTDVEDARQAANQATGLNVQVDEDNVFPGPDAGEQPSPAQPAAPPDDDLAEAHARIFQAELEQTPDDPYRALAAANEATGLQVKLAEVQEPLRQDV